MLQQRTIVLEQALGDGAGRLDKLLALQGGRFVTALSNGTKGLETSLDVRTKALEQQLHQTAGVLASGVDEASVRLAEALEQSRRALESAMRQDVERARATIEESLEHANHLLGNGLTSTQQSVASNVDKLLTRLTAHEKAAVNRMEDAATSVGENMRKAAELTAERLVALNGALVQVLSSLGSGRASGRKQKLEVIPDAAE